MTATAATAETAAPAAARPARGSIFVPAATREAIVAAHEAGRALDAWALAAPLGPLAAWEGAAALVAAGRLAPQLGAPRLGEALHLRAARVDPDHAQARYYAARVLLARRGPAAAWEAAEAARVALPDLDADADWLALRAATLAAARDFDGALPLIERAVKVAPDDPWPWVERAGLEERQDRVDAALACAREALARRPGYRPGLQAAAHALGLAGKPEEALAVLTEGPATRVQGCLLEAHRACLLLELRRPAEALAAWEAFERAAPLLDAGGRRGLEAARADCLFQLGDVARALPHARAAGGFHAAVAAHAEAHPDGRRVELDVPFLRQDHDGCAPASLAMACAAVGVEVDRRAIAAEVCYGGTPVHADRAWAERRGLVARELTLTWDAARALLDRGVPLVLGTVDPTSGHAQVVRGYDARLGLFLVQDPGQPGTREALVAPFLERYRATGPRALVVLPPAKAHLLDGLELPDAALRDRRHALQRALEVHDRAAAGAALEALRAAAPDDRITLLAARDVAAYDGDVVARLAVARRLRALDPEEPTHLIEELSGLAEVGARAERLALLEAAAARPWVDPIFPVFLARELLADGAAARDRARALARRAARLRPADPAVLALEATLRWDEGRRAGALLRWRLAACVADTDERRLDAYLRAARLLDREAEALALLRARAARDGDRSSRPVRALAQALEDGGDAPGALAALEDGLRRRPEDGELLLVAALARARQGDLDGAAALLGRAEGRARPWDARRTAARIAALAGDAPRALGLWREAAALAPTDREAHEAIAGLLARTEGPAAGVAHLAAAAAAHPHDVGLAHAWVGWAREVDPGAAEGPLREALARHPGDAWLRRELALALAEAGRLDEALAAADEGVRLEPWAASSHGIRGHVLLRAGRPAEAAVSLRACLERDADMVHAVRELALAAGPDGAREALTWFQDVLAARPSEGAGAHAWLDAWQAADLPADALERGVDALVAARGDRAWPWSLRSRLRLERGDLEGAAAAAVESTTRAPLSAPAWLDLAVVRERRRDLPGRLEALERALSVAPGHPVALRRLAHALLDRAAAPGAAPEARAADAARARGLLERAAAGSPLDARTWAALARAQEATGDVPGAVLRLERAARLDPGLAELWDELARLTKDPERVLATARAAVAARPHDARAWQRLAERLVGDAPERVEERVAAAARAAALDPRAAPAHDLLAEVLARAGRFDEALAATDPPTLRDARPVELRGRAAWVRAERGDVAGAAADMAALLEGTPHYAWGRRRLVEWYRRLQHPDYLAAAERWCALEPEHPVAHGFRGDALWACRRPAQAREALRRALALDPGYAFAAEALVDLALEARDVADAAAAQAALRAAAPGEPTTAVREVCVAAARREREAALGALAALLAHPQARRGDLERGLEAVEGAGWQGAARSALTAAARGPSPGPECGAVLVEREVAARRWDAAREHVEALLAGEGEAGRRAVVEYLDALGRWAWPAEALRFAAAHRAALRADPELFGGVASALRLGGAHAEALAWLAGDDRPAALPAWVLFEQAMSLRALGRDAEAAAVSEAALARPTDGTTRAHRAWLALDRALRGDAAAGRGVDPDAPGAWTGLRLVEALTLAVAAALAAGATLGALRAGFARARAACPTFATTPELRRAWRRAAWRGARAVGGPLAWLWAVWVALVVGRAR